MAGHGDRFGDGFAQRSVAMALHPDPMTSGRLSSARPVAVWLPGTEAAGPGAVAEL